METPARPLLSRLLTSRCGLARDQNTPGTGGPPTSSPPDQWSISGTVVILTCEILSHKGQEMPLMKNVQTGAAQGSHVGSFANASLFSNL